MAKERSGEKKKTMAKQEGLAVTENMLNNLQNRRTRLNDFTTTSTNQCTSHSQISLYEAFRIGIQERPWETTTTEFLRQWHRIRWSR